jgi:REP element-mobilizing transposase RayT
MARKPRVEFAGAFYHVIVRGNQRQKIFRDDNDRLAYLERIEHYRQRYGFSVYAYVLMSNHVHLLVETQKVSLSKIMQGLQFSYTQQYNRRHRTVGHLFQGRYKAIVCDRDAYLLELVRYIHLNPARLRNGRDPWKYRWSSHRAYLGANTKVRIASDLVLGEMAKKVGQARRAYVKFMEEGLAGGHEQKYYQTIDQRFLGDETFVEKVSKKVTEKDIEPAGPRVGFDRLIEAVAGEYELSKQTLTGKGRRREGVWGRRLLVYVARSWCQMTTKEIGKQLGRDPSMISRLYRDYQGDRDRQRETKLSRLLSRTVQIHA